VREQTDVCTVPALQASHHSVDAVRVDGLTYERGLDTFSLAALDMDDLDGYAPPPMRVYVVRHGETEENRKGVVQGQLDTKLNATGVLQAKCVAKALKDVPFVVALSSDLERAVQTSKAILAYHPDVQLSTSPGIRERYMGDLQGLTMTRERRAKLPKSVEPGDAFANRILGWWDTSVQRPAAGLPARQGTVHVLVVSHGAWIATLVRALAARDTMDIGREVTVGICHNTSVTIIDVFRNGHAKLIRYSDIAHILAGPVLSTNADDTQTGPGNTGHDGKAGVNEAKAA